MTMNDDDDFNRNRRLLLLLRVLLMQLKNIIFFNHILSVSHCKYRQVIATRWL